MKDFLHPSCRRQHQSLGEHILVFLGACGLLALLAQSLRAEESSIRQLPPVDSYAAQPAAFYDSFLTEDQDGPSEASLEERLLTLEENYLGLDEEYGELKKTLKMKPNSGHDESGMKISGRVHIDNWAFPGDSIGINILENNNPTISPQDRLGFRRLRFGVGGKLWQTMVYKIEMEFAAGNRSEFRDAYLGWNDLPVLRTLLIGNQKRPYGLDHINSSRYNVFMERPFVIEAINQDARRLGIASYGYSEDEFWNWRYGVYNLRLVQDEGNYTSDHYQPEFASRLASTFWYDEASDGRGYGHFAVSSTVANPDGSGLEARASNEARFRTRPEARSISRWIDTGEIAGAEDYQMVGLENVWNFGPVQAVAEYQNLWLQRDGGTDLHFDGGYFYVAYFLTGEHMPWNRQRGQLARIKPFENFFLVNTCCNGVQGGWGAWQVAYRLSYANFSDNDILGGRGLSHTFGLNWYWNAYSRLQFNAIYGEIDDKEGFVGDPPVSVGPVDGHYTILGVRFMVDF